MMRILVTGGLGFIGSHFVEKAANEGHEIRVLDSLAYSGRLLNLPLYKHWWHKVDICDTTKIREHLFDFAPDAVVHLAAETHVGRSIDDSNEFIRTNVVGTHCLLEASKLYFEWLANKNRFKFIHVSTDEVYGSLEWDEDLWTESSPYKPNNPYAASKAASDHLVLSYWNTFGFPAIVTHSANNYGSKQHPEKLIPILISQCLQNKPMTLHGDGGHIRDWLHVEDHCNGLLATIRRGHPGETYNFGGCCERTNEAIALLAKKVTNSESKIIYVADRPGNDRRYGMSIKKARAVLGWEPHYVIDYALADVARWYAFHPNYASEYGEVVEAE